MPPVEELVKVPKFPNVKERYRIAGDGGPLGVGRCPYSLYKDVLVNPNVQRVNFDTFVGKIYKKNISFFTETVNNNFSDGSVSSLLEHCLGWNREDEDGESPGSGDDLTSTSPLLQYLSSCDLPSPAHVKLLTSQEGCDVTSSSGQGPLHILLTSSSISNLTSASSLAAIVSDLLEAGARLDQRDEAGNTPLLCLSHLLEVGQGGVAASLAQLFCTRTDCDVNSGMLKSCSLSLHSM